MDKLLIPLKTTTTAHAQDGGDYLTPIDTKQNHRTTSDHILNTPEDALEALKSKPDLDLFTKVLVWLDPDQKRNDSFNIKVPSPKVAPIIFILIEEIIPNYWRVLKEGHYRLKKLILRCLSSIAGLGAITARLRVLLDLKDNAQQDVESTGNGKSLMIEDMLDILQNILKKDVFIAKMWEDISSLIFSVPQRTLMWKELISSIAEGRILSLSGEADQILNKSNATIKDRVWLADGNQYAAWLGRDIDYMIKTLKPHDNEAQKALTRLLEKALKLGYTGEQSQSRDSVFTF